MPAIPAFWRLKKEDSLDFKVNLNYRVRPCLKTNEPEHSFNVLIACPCLFQYNAPEEDQPVFSSHRLTTRQHFSNRLTVTILQPHHLEIVNT